MLGPGLPILFLCTHRTDTTGIPHFPELFKEMTSPHLLDFEHHVFIADMVFFLW